MTPEGGALSLHVELAGGVVRDVAIRSSRPTGLGRLMRGRAAEEAPNVARRLFALCARAHAEAARVAVAAALGRPLDATARYAQAADALTERVFETLRGLALGWPGVAPDRDAALRLREAAVAAQTFAAGGGAEAFGVLRRAAAALGLVGEPAPHSVYARILDQCEAMPALALTPPDALTPDDDEQVAAALLAEPEGFAAAPELPGRRPETGAFARAWPDLQEIAPALSARAAARGLDARQALAELEALALRQRAPGREIVACGSLGEGVGWGAIETARGRLYHVLRCDEDGRILIYGMVAPTEWNFHARGPFVGQLVGARLGRAEATRSAVERLALLVDPCCAFETVVRET